jgi:site-specific DNA-methyltransferase (adenine-specific)
MMGGDRADCMWTDPPYGVEIVGGSHAEPADERRARGKPTIRNDGSAGLPDLLGGAWAVATAVLKPGAGIYVTHPANTALAAVFAEAFNQAGWLLRQNLIWVKDSLVLGHTDYHYRHEPILFGYTDGATGRLGRSGGSGWYGDHAQTSVFEVPKPSRSESHPTMKPVALVAAMLGNSCPKRGIVYDPFGGSGSTLIAAHQLGQKARLVELDPRYADVIVRRFTEFAGIKPERVLPDGTTEPVSFT